MDGARLSPDGHAVAFASPVGGIAQVFLMLTSGGEPLQLTNDAGDKYVDNFSLDGKEVYYGRFCPSPDGASIFYTKLGNPGIFRAEKSGLSGTSLQALGYKLVLHPASRGIQSSRGYERTRTHGR
jgi:hypothetical protein